MIAAIWGWGCGQRLENETIGIRGREYALDPISESKPVDFAATDFVYPCTEETKQEIAACLGRIRANKVTVQRIWVAWEEKPIAARVLVEDTYLYLAKGDDGIWQFKQSLIVHAH